MGFEAIKLMGAKLFINKYFDGLGEVQELDVDNVAKIIAMQVVLNGEDHTLQLYVDYLLEADAVTAVHFRCEREWIEAALNRFLAGKRFDIPDGLVKTTLYSML
jgi:DNA-directed RNA polymerase subunit L